MDFMNYLQENKKQCLSNAALLAADGRNDDSIMEKVRANVFDIFIQTKGQTHLLEHFLATWSNALTLADEHGDAASAAIEQVKLNVLSEITQEANRHA